MNKFKLFIENFLVYGLGGIITNLVPLIMIPVVTRIMPNSSYFAISDLSNMMISFASALAIMGMYDAMYRMFFEKETEEYKKRVCSTTLIFTMLVSVVVCLVMVLTRDGLARVFFGTKEYGYVVLIAAFATLFGATNSIISAPTRMQNKRKVFLITNTLSPLISYGIAIPLLLRGHYVTALPLAALISVLVLEISFAIMNRSWFKIHIFDRKLLKQLLVIALPLLPNFLVYWIFNSSDRLMITNLIGLEAAGIYAVGAKLGMASQLIYVAFSGGWQFFAFSTMKDDDQVETNSKIFEYLGVISFVATAFICAWSYGIYKVLFVGDYVKGYIIAPYLFLAPLLQMLFQVQANQFLVIKKTWPNILILSSGAILNVVLNLVLIPRIGIEGAAIATLLGYTLSDIICYLVLIKMKLMKLSRRFCGVVAVQILFLGLWRCMLTERALLGTLMAVVLTAVYIFMYRRELIGLYNRLVKK